MGQGRTQILYSLGAESHPQLRWFLGLGSCETAASRELLTSNKVVRK